MFLLGAAKNVGADQLIQSVEIYLENLKTVTGASFLQGEASAFDNSSPGS